ncbi:transglycosylase domain-containing protein [Aeromonas rivipollensis]|uniref:Transglycosylase domain-containing protein n=1 Tax=Aeromonas rivipollensis TaxID=948519 RepID=A0ABX0CVH1_9GAMM|nr:MULTISPECIES: biosynthetic peptidoglycan transglycosylase [Aeromonas]NEX87767.1 transglycosylase domain-containing protein [Aeromonas rivipollensis]NEY05681.1 transglycosylase domain-containing protein [Aeromonas rivipollensis]
MADEFCLELPRLLKNTLVVGEDHRFWNHSGVDYFSLLRAVIKTGFFKNREGGSTIAMQLVRVITSNYQVTLKRKVIEIFLAKKITRIYGREKILNKYLQMAYFGWNMHGVIDASTKLKINIRNMSLVDAAELIARLKYPQSRFHNPIQDSKIKRRSVYIVDKSISRYGV